MEKNKKKILIFLTRMPYPPVDGTRFKILKNVLEGLKPDFGLEFCIITDDKVKRSQVEYLEKNFGPVHLFLHGREMFYWNALKSIFSTLPIQAGYYHFRNVERWFLKNEKNYDVVYVHTLRLGRYAEKLNEADRRKVLLDFNDAISLNYKEGKRFASPFWRIVYSIEEKRIRKYEVKLLSELSYFNIASRRDKEYLLENYSALRFPARDFVFESVRHGIDSKILSYDWVKRDDSLVFIGNLKYPPNADAVRYFLKVLWPAISKEMPALKLTIIGRNDGLGFENGERVNFTGFVDDPYKTISESGVFVAPLRFGAGTPTKILEAMAIGIPVITTPLGVRGIEGARVGKDLLVEEIEDVEGWTRAVKLLLSDDDLARRIGESGKKLVVENYLDQRSRERFRELFHEIVKSSQ